MKILLIILVLGIVWGFTHPRQVYRDIPVKGVSSISQPTSTPSPTPDTKEVIDEITEVWKEEKKSDIIRAINCAYSESGFNPIALNKNKNFTQDAGIFQINDIHKMTLEDRFNIKKNIKKAYEIFKSRKNWSAWYGEGCI